MDTEFLDNSQSIEDQIMKKYEFIMEKTIELKTKGNQYYSREKYEEAMFHYEAAVNSITHKILNELYWLNDKRPYELLITTKKECILNNSLMLLKLKKYQKKFWN